MLNFQLWNILNPELTSIEFSFKYRGKKIHILKIINLFLMLHSKIILKLIVMIINILILI